MNHALITGITGQDGRHLAELLLEKGDRVYGLLRGQHNPKRLIVEREVPDVELIEGDLTDQVSLISALQKARPNEVYNLGAMSFVALSWKQPELTGNVTGLGALRLLEAIRNVEGSSRSARRAPGIKFYQASSSEMFGRAHEVPQSEQTRFHPRSPYGVAKVFAHHITVNYRESYGMFACSGILFNHTGPRRGPEFVSRKISIGVARIKLGLQDKLMLGNLESKRDWGYAGDYVKAMHLMLQQDKPDDYVIGSGQSHSVREFAEMAFGHVGLDWQKHVVIDPGLLRPAEVDLLEADWTKARAKLGWQPKVSFEELVQMMVDADLQSEKRSA
ncbi:MAG TPA: GDP-mannose 4,6-dehydratase [Chloroflexota bacterium]|nr:GDP-mannose 4,6-dehydratase [Chloroflexota bacterium]